MATEEYSDKFLSLYSIFKQSLNNCQHWLHVRLPLMLYYMRYFESSVQFRSRNSVIAWLAQKQK